MWRVVSAGQASKAQKSATERWALDEMETGHKLPHASLLILITHPLSAPTPTAMPAGGTEGALPAAAPAEGGTPAAKKNKLTHSSIDTAAAAAAPTHATKPKVRWCEEDNTTNSSADGGGAEEGRAGHGGARRGGRHPYSVRPMGDLLAQGTVEVSR